MGVDTDETVKGMKYEQSNRLIEETFDWRKESRI